MTLPFGFTENEYNLVLKYLNKNNVLLEYGCGISTSLFSEHVSHLYSIEHDKKWYNKINENLNNIENITLTLIEPNIKDHPLSYHPYDNEELNHDDNIKLLRDYIYHQNNIIFDDIFIDGRARLHCSEVAFNLLTNNSYLIFHDFINRPYYHRCLEKYKIVDRVDTLAILQKL